MNPDKATHRLPGTHGYSRRPVKHHWRCSVLHRARPLHFDPQLVSCRMAGKNRQWVVEFNKPGGWCMAAPCVGCVMVHGFSDVMRMMREDMSWTAWLP